MKNMKNTNLIRVGCPNCQGEGCPVCSCTGYIKNILTANQREIEKENLFKAATLPFKFTENDLCCYSMYNNHNNELHEELIEELVQEGRLNKLQYDPKRDTFHTYNGYLLNKCIEAYQRNWDYGEPIMTDEELVDELLKIEEVK